MKQVKSYFLILLFSATIFSCSDDDTPINTDKDSGENPEDPSEVESRYIVAATPNALEGVADYLLALESLNSGEISLVGNGVEQDGTYRYYIKNNNKFFSLLYGQGNPGAVTTYQLNATGKLDMISDFQAETVQSFTNMDDEILMTKISRNSTNPFASWYRLDTKTSQLIGEGQINTQEIIDNDELAFFTWMTQVGDRVYAPFMSVKACCNDSFGTNYPDQAWIAVYSYPEMELQTIIEDDRTSFIGRYFTSGLGVVESGDIYAFSSSVATNNGEANSIKPSAITRIKAGEEVFDDSYFFNLEEASNGYYMTQQTYIGNGAFLLNMSPVATKGAYTTGKRLAIVNVYDKSLIWVEGLPAESAIKNITGQNNYVEDDIVHIGVTTEAGSYIYQIDATNAKATKGIEVQGGTITAISKLEIEN
ncbi:DUF4374 domain-containing protein [Zunongwangia pacifica]|uniref:DUF4374 domain-containing protein n=1 Tax=Zunongwangia pacifica TaxID=2911062 RepID=A0A9X1ZNW5_9FLAO|nr:DUF4374 domain-containing protein [Zunongwangia pacifica]MCL6218182.1 DUF4374 domain-containing protein [Zunongwangia pacifica]